MLEAMENYNCQLTKEKLCTWHIAFFPTGYSDSVKIKVGAYRTHEEHIVSGMFGMEKIHYVAQAQSAPPTPSPMPTPTLPHYSSTLK